ncbi:hypothetical protein Btru_048426 [Bulinus truncatus]|nr:hypothetical protein Btru_048426 [Bulinus truncatus]
MNNNKLNNDKKPLNAKEIGVSKEDFMQAWESSMAIERKNAEAKLKELGGNVDTALDRNISRNNMNQTLNHEKMADMTEQLNNLRLEFQQTFESFRIEMILKHEQLKKDMEEECRLNLDSMKVYVQNEIELLYQNRGDVPTGAFSLINSINNLSINDQKLEGVNKMLTLPHQLSIPQDQQFDIPQVQQLLPQQFSIPHEQQTLPQPSSLLKTQHTTTTGKDYEQESSWNTASDSKLEKFISNIPRSYAAAAAPDHHNKEEFEQILKPGVDIGSGGGDMSNLVSTQALGHNTMEATGFIAQIISQQLAQKGTSPSRHSSRSRSRAKRKEIIPYQGVTLGKLGKLPLAKHSPASSVILPLSETGVEFSISNCSRWEATKTDYYTPYCYTFPARCKARLQLRFSAKGFLCVNILLTKGADDDFIKWPVRISGWGEIYNHGSRRFTPVWSVDPQNCSKPGGALEYSIGATVSLITSRGAHNDVTFAKLKEKRYEFQDSFTFKWCLKAEDDIAK